MQCVSGDEISMLARLCAALMRGHSWQRAAMRAEGFRHAANIMQCLHAMQRKGLRYALYATGSLHPAHRPASRPARGAVLPDFERTSTGSCPSDRRGQQCVMIHVLRCSVAYKVEPPALVITTRPPLDLALIR